MNYAIFRSEAIKTLKDLGQIGAHNQRKKEAYQSNPDIIKEKSVDNILLVGTEETYLKQYMKIVKPYKEEHDERMKKTRENRRKSFHQMLDDSNSVVADELIFTATNEYFKDKDTDTIKRWGETCLEFVYQDLGYEKWQVLNATIHLDETTPHLHCVIVPLIKKCDKRTKTERYTISKKQYVKGIEHLRELQDKYWERLNKAGFELERGIRGSNNINVKIREYKKLTKKIGYEMNKQNLILQKSVNKLEEDMQTSKETIVGDYIKIKKDTYNSMKDVVEKTKKSLEKVPQMEYLITEMNNHIKTYTELDKKNFSMKKEIDNLKFKNEELKEENSLLKHIIKDILKNLKKIFRKILHIGSNDDKDVVVNEVSYCYNNDLYKEKDIIDICKDTDREEEILEATNLYEKDNDKEFEI
ncbi:MAG: MobV family relaxase [Bacilli bacterium]